MTRIVLVRHGETEWHEENRYAGSSDIELNTRGKQQAEALALWAVDAGLTRIYVSPLARARATAAPVERALGMKASVDPRLRELHFGTGEGLTAREMRERLPEAYRAFEADPVAFPLPGGEDPHALIARGREALDEIARAADGERVRLVGHSTWIRLLLSNLLGINPARYRQIFPVLRNAALSELRVATEPFTAGLLRFNLPIEDKES